MNNDNNKTYTVEEDNKENVSTSHDDLLKDVIEEEKAEKDKNTDKDNKKEKKKKDKTPKSHKKLKHATMSTILTCVFLAVLVLVNVVTTMLFERYPITIDLTADKIYSVSEDSEEYVKNVDTDVLVTIFNTQDNFENYNDYTKQAFEVLKRYCKLNPKISYRFVDIDSNPEIVSEYTDSVSTNEIIFETNTEVDGETIKRTRSLGLVDLLSFNDEITQYFSNYGMSIETGIQQMGGIDTFLYYYGSYVEASNAEQAFTSALMTVTDPNPVYVTFLTGRSELTELSYFQTLLTANGYNVNTIDITAEEIPENTDVIVIPSPKTDYLEAEITKISNFLNNDGNLGKNLIYCANVQQEDTPNLNEFLAEYGLEIGEGAIGEADSNYYYANQFETLITDLSDSFTQDVETESPKLLSGYSKPVNTLFDEQGMIVTEKYAKSSESAFTIDTQTGDVIGSGKQCYFAVGSKAKFEDDGSTIYSNVLALGTSNLLEDTVLSYTQYQNREYFLSVLNGITHKTDGVTITPKVIKGNVFDINDKQKTILKWTFCLIVPVIILVAGTVVWLRRKNR